MRSEIDINSLRAMHAATTQGEWEHTGGVLVFAGGEPVTEGFGKIRQARDDAAFIAAAHNIMPALLDELERLREENQQLVFEKTTLSGELIAVKESLRELRQHVDFVQSGKMQAEIEALKVELAARDSNPVDNSEPRLSAEQSQEVNRMLANGECKPKGPLAFIPDVDNSDAIRERLLQPFYGSEAETLGATEYQLRDGEEWCFEWGGSWLPTDGPMWIDTDRYRLAKGD